MTDTTLRVSKEVRDDLAKLGSKDDSFNAILRRLIDQCEREAVELTTRIRNAKTDEERTKLLDQKVAAVSRGKQITEEIGRLQTEERRRKEDEENMAKQRAVEMVNADLDRFAKTRFLCGACDHVLRYAGPRTNRGLGLSGEGWKSVSPPYEYLLALQCDGCGTEMLRSPSELAKLAKASERTAKPKRLAKGDTFAGSL